MNQTQNHVATAILTISVVIVWACILYLAPSTDMFLLDSMFNVLILTALTYAAATFAAFLDKKAKTKQSNKSEQTLTSQDNELNKGAKEDSCAKLDSRETSQ
jgi:hypothetical protein